MFQRWLRCVATALLVFGMGLVAWQPAADANTGKTPAKARAKAQAALRAKFASHIKFGKGPEALGSFYKGFCMHMDAISAALAAGSKSPADAAFDFANEWMAFLEGCASVSETVINTGVGNVNDAFAADSSLQPSDSALGLLPGQGGLWDKFVSDWQKELDKIKAKAMAKLKKMQQAANRAAAKGCVNVVAGGPSVGGAAVRAPNPGGAQAPKAPGVPKPKEFKMDTEASASTVDQPTTGVICVGGQADPANGNKVTVTIYDKNGAPVGVPQTVNISNKCRWRACFPPSPPFNLPSGQYRVEATQTTGGSSTAVDFSIP